MPSLLVVGGAVGEDVLVADGVVDRGEVSGSSPWKSGAEAHAAGHGGEGLELVLGLEVVDVADAGAHAASPPFISLSEAPVPMVKMVTLGVALILARILSRVSLEKVSRPVPMRMMYLRPSMRLVRSSVS